MKSSQLQKMSPERLRELLNAFYSGDSTAAAEDELIGYFPSSCNIPAEFKADAAMFRAMADARGRAADVPADLEGRILAATVGRRSPRRYVWLYKAASMAAVVALLFGVGLRISRDTQQTPAPSIHTPSELIAKTEDIAVVDTLAVEPHHECQASKAVAHARPRKVKTVERPTNDYRIVTDTVQALEIADRALAMLGASLELGAKGMRKAEVASVNFDNTIESIYIAYN